MRSTLALSTIAACAIAVSAQDCNPSYDVAPSTTCYTNCNVQAGSAFVSGWTMDHTSPNFLKSLTLMCDKTGANYSTFMANAGMCMVACAGDDPELFNTEWANACAWWQIHKDDTCASSATTSTTTKVATTTTTTTTEVTTTTVAATTTSATTTTAAAESVETTSSAVDTTITTATAVVVESSPIANASATAPVVATAVVNASSPISSASSAAVSGNSTTATGASTSAPVAATQSPNGANKLQLSGYALALIAGACVYAL